MNAWHFSAVPPGPYQKKDLFEAHGGHGEGRDLRYRTMTVADDGSLLLGGLYSLASRQTSAVSREALVARLQLQPGNNDPVVSWTALLTEVPGYGLSTLINDIVESSGEIYLTGSTSHWGQDEGCIDRNPRS